MRQRLSAEVMAILVIRQAYILDLVQKSLFDETLV
jgi:hypothetical protein